MNFLQNTARKMLAKALGFPPMASSDHGLWRYLYSGGPSSAGVMVTPQSSLALAPLYGCARVWCNTMGSIPCQVYRDTAKGREIARKHPLYWLLHDSPNMYMTSLEWRETMTLGLALQGNSYSSIQRIGGRVVSLNPLRPDWMIVHFDAKGLWYEYQNGATGKREIYPAEDILHLKNFSLDGIHGLSPIGMLREVIGRGLAMQQYSSSFFRNGGRPGGVLMHEKSLTEEAVKRIRDGWQKLHGGPENAGQIAILWEGMKYQNIGVPPGDAQFVETAHLTAADIACAYGVPMNKLAQSDKTATYASAEQFSLDFVKDTVRPMAVRFEQAINKSVVGPRSDVFVEFDLEGLLRGDAASRAEFYSKMVQHGIMTRAEVRRKENLPEIEGADALTVQSNMLDLADLAAIGADIRKPAAAVTIRA